MADLREKYIRDQYSIEMSGYERGKEEGEAIGRAEGEAIGASETKIKIAREMLNKNLDVNLIVECTGLTIKEIKNL